MVRRRHGRRERALPEPVRRVRATVTIMREIITLACGDCKRRNYSTTKNRRKSSERLEFSKYCRHCRKHTAHKGEVSKFTERARDAFG